MNKIFLPLFLIFISFSFVHAEEVKQTKQVKETKKKELSKEDEEFLKQFTALNKEEKDIKDKTLKLEKKLEKTKQIGKTLDEINNTLGVDKK